MHAKEGTGLREIRWSMRRKTDTPEAKAFWQDIEDAAFEVEETERLQLPYTRFSAYRRGFEDGYRQALEEVEYDG